MTEIDIYFTINDLGDSKIIMEIDDEYSLENPNYKSDEEQKGREVDTVLSQPIKPNDNHLVVVFDIDNTLLHSAHNGEAKVKGNKIKSQDVDSMSMMVRGNLIPYAVKMRPGVADFIDEIRKLIDEGKIRFLMYTAGSLEYVNALYKDLPIFKSIINRADILIATNKYRRKSFKKILRHLGGSMEDLKSRLIIFDDKVYQTWEETNNQNIVQVKPYYYFDEEEDRKRDRIFEDLPRKLPKQDSYTLTDVELFNIYLKLIKNALESGNDVRTYLQEEKEKVFKAGGKLFSDKNIANKYRAVQVKGNYHFCLRGLIDPDSSYEKSKPDVRGYSEVNLENLKTGISSYTSSQLKKHGGFIEEDIERAHFVLTSNIVSVSPEQTRSNTQMLDEVLTVSIAWALDCIFSFQLLPIDTYIIHQPNNEIFLGKDKISDENDSSFLLLTEKRLQSEENKKRESNLPAITKIYLDQIKQSNYLSYDPEELFLTPWREKEEIFNQFLEYFS